MKILIIYQSKYGSSRQYAQWMADALKCKSENADKLDISELKKQDLIIYTAGLYAGQVSGFKKLCKHFDTLGKKQVLLCTVGLTNPANHDYYQQVYQNNVPEQYRGMVKHFALQGDQLFSKMGWLHRLMMNMPKKMVEKKPVQQRTAEDNLLLENFGKDIRLASQESICEIVKYVKTLAD